MIFFYYKKCNICVRFKPQFEYIASTLKQQPEFADVNFGMVDVMESEKLKETFKIKVSPWFAFIKNGTIYEYEGTRNLDAFKVFILRDHENLKATGGKKPVYPIPLRIGWWGL